MEIKIKTKINSQISCTLRKIRCFLCKVVYLIFIITIFSFYGNAKVVLASDLEPPSWLLIPPNADVVTIESETEVSTESEGESEAESTDESESTDTSNVTSIPTLPEDISEKDTPYMDTFKISAYYSPLPGQTRYFTGSYAGDIRLNGGGVKGADGTPVYPGMIAAPKNYPFGTKMEIPGVGTVAVHDRGGAIVNSGARGNSFDRLDIWMGYGDKGLKRALNWGKRTLDVKVYGINPTIAENVYLEDYTEEEKYFIASNPTSEYSTSSNSGGTDVSSNGTTATPKALFSSQLSYGMEGDEVKELKQILKSLNYLEGDVDSKYDMATMEAVQKFQLEKKVITTPDDFGAGFVGPRTMSILASLKDVTPLAHAESSLIEFNDITDAVFMNDLALGDEGEEVLLLQEELKKFHLLGIEPTGQYDEVTEHAVFKFQQIHNIVDDKLTYGAGVFGPQTRYVLNKILFVRRETELLTEEEQIDE